MSENSKQQNPFDTSKLPEPTPKRKREIVHELEQVVADAQAMASKGGDNAAVAELIAAETSHAIEALKATLGGATSDETSAKSAPISVPNDSSIPRLKR